MYKRYAVNGNIFRSTAKNSTWTAVDYPRNPSAAPLTPARVGVKELNIPKIAKRLSDVEILLEFGSYMIAGAYGTPGMYGETDLRSVLNEFAEELAGLSSSSTNDLVWWMDIFYFDRHRSKQYVQRRWNQTRQSSPNVIRFWESLWGVWYPGKFSINSI